jgi:hypothetical protein
MDDTNYNDSAEDTVTEEAIPEYYGHNPSEIVARYTHCKLCGANLHFSYVTDFSRNITHESARCPECGVRSRQAVHQLQ